MSEEYKSVWREFIEEVDDKQDYELLKSDILHFLDKNKEVDPQDKKDVLDQIEKRCDTRLKLMKCIYNVMLKYDGSDAVKLVKKKKRNKFYVNSEEFEQEIVKFYDSNVISDKLSTMIMDMVNGMAYAPNFIRYSFRDEVIGDCYESFMKALRTKKYKPGTVSVRNPEKQSTAFSYFNAISYNCWRNRIKKEERHRETIKAYQEEVYIDHMRLYGYTSPDTTNEENSD